MTPAGTLLHSVLTCPYCGNKSTELMPENECRFFQECPQCLTVLRPKSGDCCVFCSYGSVPCPPVQSQQSCCQR